MRRFRLIVCPLLWIAAGSGLLAADRNPDKPIPKGEMVEIFSAIDAGQIDVRLIPKSSKKCRLLVTNKTDKPLNVILPRAFAGVPVLAQQGFGMMGPQGAFGQNGRQNNRPQGLGIGPAMGQNRGQNLMNVPGQNMGPNMMPGPFFNVAPEKVGNVSLPSVCLDHGLPDPTPRMKYAIKPIDDHTKKPGVAEVCVMLGRGEIPQRVAQLAAWHLSNDNW